MEEAEKEEAEMAAAGEGPSNLLHPIGSHASVGSGALYRSALQSLMRRLFNIPGEGGIVLSICMSPATRWMQS